MAKKGPGSFSGQFAVVSGGSKGIGKATAKEIVSLGGSVCLVARDAAELERAAKEVETVKGSAEQFVETIACDATDLAALRPKLEELVNRHGTPDHLINVVGYAFPQYVEKLTLEDYEKNMKANYYGQLVPTIILIPYFIKARKGHISFVSSIAGFLGIMGYAAYTPTKFALVGLAEVLRHELKPYHIGVSVLYPPDTDTAGFAIENQTKPPETAMISETAKLMTPEQVASSFIKGLLKKKFHILIGEGRWIRLLVRLFPGLVHAITDGDYAKARKKLGKI